MAKKRDRAKRRTLAKPAAVNKRRMTTAPMKASDDKGGPKKPAEIIVMWSQQLLGYFAPKNPARPKKAEVQRFLTDRKKKVAANSIILFDSFEDPEDKVWCFVNGEFFAHDDKHPLFKETVLDISIRKQEEVAWSCDTDSFSIDALEWQAETIKGPAPLPAEFRPFAKDLPFVCDAGRDVTSGPARPSAKNQQYKATITVAGRAFDPDIFCSP